MSNVIIAIENYFKPMLQIYRVCSFIHMFIEILFTPNDWTFKEQCDFEDVFSVVVYKISSKLKEICTLLHMTTDSNLFYTVERKVRSQIMGSLVIKDKPWVNEQCFDGEKEKLGLVELLRHLSKKHPYYPANRLCYT